MIIILYFTITLCSSLLKVSSLTKMNIFRTQSFFGPEISSKLIVKYLIRTMLFIQVLRHLIAKNVYNKITT